MKLSMKELRRTKLSITTLSLIPHIIMKTYDDTQFDNNQHNNTQHNCTQHSSTQHKDTLYNIQHYIHHNNAQQHDTHYDETQCNKNQFDGAQHYCQNADYHNFVLCAVCHFPKWHGAPTRFKGEVKPIT